MGTFPIDLSRPGERLARGGTGADDAPEIDDHHANVGHLPGGHPDDVPVALRFRHRVKQVRVLLRKRLCRGGVRALPREDGDVGDVDGGDRVEGGALAQVVGAVQSPVLIGVARDSGTLKGGRHMAAMAARTSNPDMKETYERLVERGEPHKVAVTAVMRKLVVTANALLRDRRTCEDRTADAA
ncbi:MAG: hypothetical protein F4Y68_06660 [Boseongicola sp. SB0665_bin_10]|nr:hypothetical protein [Boseongicola sp. SB0665_bin_10]